MIKNIKSKDVLITSSSYVTEQNRLFEEFKKSDNQKAYISLGKRIDRCCKQLENIVSFCKNFHEGGDAQDLIIETCIIKGK
jgi:uroporphyrinogen-III synthase